MISGISVGIEYKNDNIDQLASIREPIQLGLYKHTTAKKIEKEVIKIIQDNNISVATVHLPIDCLKYDYCETIELMDAFNYEANCSTFIIHPNKGIIRFLHYVVNRRPSHTICVENFQWRRKKELRSSLDIWEFCQNKPNIKMVFDTSHAEEEWFSDPILPFILREIEVIHLSNRIGREQHKPFNVSKGDLNLVGFIRKLKHNYQWDGTIILEYKSEYHDHLYKDLYYLRRLWDG